MTKKKKRRSQAPVALVYFLTLLLALSLAGGVSYYLLKKYEVFKPGVTDSEKDSTRCVGIMFARVNDTGDFQDMCVMRIDPFNKEITIVPQSDVTKTSDGKTYREIMNSGGMELLRKKAAENLGGITIDFYATVTNSAFEQVADLMGGMSYTAPQELYHISQESSKDDISLQKGDLVTLSGRQIVNLASYDIFNDKKEIITTGSNTNLTKDAFNEIRRYLEVMLDERDIPAKSLTPQGSWNSDYTAFTMKSDYISQVADTFGVKKQAAVTAKITEPPAKSPDESTSGK